MIRTFLTTTALAALMASGAIAQDAPANTTEAPAAEAPATDTETTEPADTEATDTEATDAEATDAEATDAEPSADGEEMEEVEVKTVEGGATSEGAATGGAVLAEGYQVVDTDNLASNIMGAGVYTSAGDDAEHIGDINDLVIGEDGNVAAVIIGVGGFLGIGEKGVAVDYSELEWVVAADNTERFVINATREQLEAAPAFERAEDDPAVGAAGTDNAMAPADAPADGAMAPAPGGAMAPADNAMAPADSTQMQEVDTAALTADDLEDTDVYGPGDEHIGTIGDLILGTDETIDAVIIDFGGFLGIGVKQVAVAYENLQFMRDGNDNLILTLNMTREQMEQAPEYNADTYEAERDTQRVVVQ